MLILVLFAFLGGLVTILSPCILPILPIILSGAVGVNKNKPMGIIVGFVLSFTFFTLFLTSLVEAIGISSDALRSLSIFILFVAGLIFLVPWLQVQLEKVFSKFFSHSGNSQNHVGFGGGLVIGFSLGLLWTPCVGPILASVISLALSGSISGSAFIITLAYAVGTALPMLAIMHGGRQLLSRVPWLLKNSANIQKFFAVIMIITAALIYFNIDRKFQAYIIDRFPNYGSTITGLENNNLIDENLNKFLKFNNKMETNKLPMAPEIQVSGEWLNSSALQLADLKGKVVLLDFMTYSCINCIRTFPYLEAWHQAYKDNGLVVIGIHSPEFEFEKDPANLQKALADFGLTFPIMQDNDFKTWRAYDNRYWPHTFLINHLGQIAYDHIGEGGYDKTEAKIKELLREKDNYLDSGNYLDKEVSKNLTMDKPGNVQSPEIYFGSNRNQFFGNGLSQTQGLQNLDRPSSIDRNILYLVGSWNIEPEFAENVSSGSSIIFKYSAKKIFFVAGANKNISVRIIQDGKDQGVVNVWEEKLYTLVENASSGEHTIELIPQEPGLQVFTFTFG